ncbi:MAG: hypothetical protein ACE5F1_12575 [Planctomycetota bacterium]
MSRFTWQDYEEHGFAGLETALGEGFLVSPVDEPHAVDVYYRGTRIGRLLAVNPEDILFHLGPSECTHIDCGNYHESCLNLSYEGELFPDDSSPSNLAEAARSFRRRAGA